MAAGAAIETKIEDGEEGGTPRNPKPSMRGQCWGNILGLNPLATGGQVTPAPPENGRARGGTPYKPEPKPNERVQLENIKKPGIRGADRANVAYEVQNEAKQCSEIYEEKRSVPNVTDGDEVWNEAQGKVKPWDVQSSEVQDEVQNVAVEIQNEDKNEAKLSDEVQNEAQVREEMQDEVQEKIKWCGMEKSSEVKNEVHSKVEVQCEVQRETKICGDEVQHEVGGNEVRSEVQNDDEMGEVQNKVELCNKEKSSEVQNEVKSRVEAQYEVQTEAQNEGAMDDKSDETRDESQDEGELSQMKCETRGRELKPLTRTYWSIWNEHPVCQVCPVCQRKPRET